MTWTRSSFCNNSACVEWHKASASNSSGNCLEAGWSTPCNNSACAEAIHDDGTVKLRDTKTVKMAEKFGTDYVVLSYTPEEWDEGRAVVFEPVSSTLVPAGIWLHRNAERMRKSEEFRDNHWYRVSKDGQELWFDQEEVDAWKSGVRAGEMALA